MQAKVFGSALHGVDAFRITIEVSVDKGLGYMITGLPDVGIRESYNRIGVAIQANGYSMPRTRLTINLAPADVRKEGTAYDLPIALGILIASKQVPVSSVFSDYLFAAELGLNGSLYSVRGALCMAYQAKREGYKGIILPADNAREASLVDGINVYGAESLKEVVAFIKDQSTLNPFVSLIPIDRPVSDLDFSQVKGQTYAKRALEIMAAGGHHGLLIGPPGTGKSLLAKRLGTILPPMTMQEALETTRIHSIGKNDGKLSGLIFERPFINPHHTASDVALTGGGSFPRPGAISMAHNGVLFLDELGEFKNTAIEVLRQPMEDRKVLIARVKQSLEYPASFTLLAAMNPCACGYLNHPTRKCSCNKKAISSYRRKLSGPILERIDMHIEVDPVPIEALLNNQNKEEDSLTIRKRVIKARNLQMERFVKHSGIYCNAQMPDAVIGDICLMEAAAQKFLFSQMEKMGLSARSYSRILKVARTIADLEDTVLIQLEHIAEAIHFRKLDQPFAG